MAKRFLRTVLAAAVIWFGLAAWIWAEGPASEAGGKGSRAVGTSLETKTSGEEEGRGSSNRSTGSTDSRAAAAVKDAKATSGLFTVYQKDNNLYIELSSSAYSSEYIVLISIARGIAHGSLLGGMSWDDHLWKFRKIDKRVHVVRRNVRYRAKPGSPTAAAVKNAYTDSVLFSLPVLGKGPKGGDLVDFTSVFMSDFPQISHVLPGYSFSSSKSSWASIKGFPDNMELEVAATYASSGRGELESVPDSRGATINVHYSISKLKKTGYTPRLADDRVGYFLTVVKDFSKKTARDQFVRYINRWDLRKADASADRSPPKKPIIFWIEKTVPFPYRAPIREGILEWNKAFEAAGFVNAIEVRQQPDDAEWEPEDINYNTFRWITSDAGFAMGPSRVDPYTGQILDSDIIFDADFLQAWKARYEDLARAGSEAGGGAELADRVFGVGRWDRVCRLSFGMAREMAFGSAAIAARSDPAQAKKDLEKLIMQGLKEVTMHEVGHTLGLRHNFKGSRLLSLEEMQDVEKTRQKGMVASVMDYAPVNIAPKGARQGDYFTTTIGPYDIWAIQYGYTPLSGGTEGEVKKLREIAARSGEPALAYATDGDLVGDAPDPDCNEFDLGKDPLEYAQWLARVAAQLTPGLVDRMVREGEDYSLARQAFNVLLSERARGMMYAARYIGGVRTSRSHKGDKNAAEPLVPVDAKQQRAALSVLEREVFSDRPFRFPPELFHYLAAPKWRHWGMHDAASSENYPIHAAILSRQLGILYQILSSTTLARLYDTELMTPADRDAFTAAELLHRVTKAVFSEVDQLREGEYTTRKPAISSLRRNLQRALLSRLGDLALGRTAAPADCETIAYAEIEALKSRIDQLLLQRDIRLDEYSHAHLLESSGRIQKILDAKLSLLSP